MENLGAFFTVLGFIYSQARYLWVPFSFRGFFLHFALGSVLFLACFCIGDAPQAFKGSFMGILSLFSSQKHFWDGNVGGGSSSFLWL
jgi:hypothetical protein